MRPAAILLALIATRSPAEPAGPPRPAAVDLSLAEQAIAHAAARNAPVTPCVRRAGEITVCGDRDGRAEYGLPLPDARPPRRHPSEPTHIGVGDSPARVAPGVGLTLTVPIGSKQAPAGKASVQGTAIIRDGEKDR